MMINNNSAQQLHVHHRLTCREQVTPAIVHLGLGAFHRGHQALLTDEFMALSGQRNWGIIAANLVGDSNVIDGLQAQDNLYTVTEIASDGSHTTKLVSAIIETLHASEDRHRLLGIMSHEQTRIVTLTITAKGYGLDFDTGALNEDDPLIARDLFDPDHPRSAIGLIVMALAHRRQAGLSPFTVLSCDNIPDNGRVARHAVLQLANLLDPELARWIAEQGSFPSTLVDRVVPQVTVAEQAEIAQFLGADDKAAVVCGDFRQWLIEDNFTMGRPDWDDVDGVSFVEDIRPYADMKLRMLNGAHSLLAYLGLLDQQTDIAATLGQAAVLQATRRYLFAEVLPALTMPAGADPHAYGEQLLARFTNTEMGHSTRQIATDGSCKIPQRWLNSVRWHLDHGSDYSVHALGIAAWIQSLTGVDLKGQAIPVHDRLDASLSALIKANPQPASLVRAIVSREDIFGTDLAHDLRFVDTVISAMHLLSSRGVHGALASLKTDLRV